VWLPWTEDPEDLAAQEFRRRSRLVGKTLSWRSPLLKKEKLDTKSQVSRPSNIAEAPRAVRFRWWGLGAERPAIAPRRAIVSLPGVDDVRIYVLGPPDRGRSPAE